MAEEKKADNGKISELQRLMNLERDLAKQFKDESDEISVYEMGATAGYDAGSESPDLSLMRKLAEQAYMNEQFASPSNTAAQFAMLLDPKFQTVFKDATSQRVNAARKYFASTGAIARQAQSERSAKASARKRSDRRLGSLGNQLQDVRRSLASYDEVDKRLAQQASEKAKDRWAAQKRTQTAADAKGEGVKMFKIPVLLKTATANIRNNEADLEPSDQAKLRENLFKNTVLDIEGFEDTPAGRRRRKDLQDQYVEKAAVLELRKNHVEVTPQQLDQARARARYAFERKAGNVVIPTGGTADEVAELQKRAEARRRASGRTGNE